MAEHTISPMTCYSTKKSLPDGCQNNSSPDLKKKKKNNVVRMFVKLFLRHLEAEEDGLLHRKVTGDELWVNCIQSDTKRMTTFFHTETKKEYRTTPPALKSILTLFWDCKSWNSSRPEEPPVHNKEDRDLL